MAKLSAVEQPEQAALPVYSETLKICCYGQFGSRKTLAIGQLIDAGAEVLVMSAERGLNTIASRLPRATVLVAANLDEFRRAYGEAKAWAELHPAGWVCVDGGSQVAEWIANQQLSGAEAYYDAKARNQTIATDLLPYGRFMSDKGAIDTMRIYGRIGRDSENLLAALIGLPCNLYVNYLEEKTGSSGYERTLPYGPDVPGKVGLRAVMSSFDYVVRLAYNAQRELVAYLDPASALYMARTREDRTVVQLPTEIPNFNLAEFAGLLRGEAATKQPA